MSAALARYRVFAYATGVLLVLLTISVVWRLAEMQFSGIPYSDTEGLGHLIPGSQVAIPIAHGWLYLAYLITTVDLWFRTGKRLAVGRTVLVALAGTIPFMSFVAERWVRHQVKALIAETPAVNAST